jgi:sulfur relay (sulfurtransferase) complex TusBCD TusD component (DsrE family)
MDARGLRDEEIVASSRRSTLEELTKATLASDKVLVF